MAVVEGRTGAQSQGFKLLLMEEEAAMQSASANGDHISPRPAKGGKWRQGPSAKIGR